MNMHLDRSIGKRVEWLLEYAKYSNIPLVFGGWLWEDDYLYQVECIYPVGFVQSSQFELTSILHSYPNCNAILRSFGVLVYSRRLERVSSVNFSQEAIQ